MSIFLCNYDLRSEWLSSTLHLHLSEACSILLLRILNFAHHSAVYTFGFCFRVAIVHRQSLFPWERCLSTSHENLEAWHGPFSCTHSSCHSCLYFVVWWRMLTKIKIKKKTQHSEKEASTLKWMADSKGRNSSAYPNYIATWNAKCKHFPTPFHLNINCRLHKIA